MPSPFSCMKYTILREVYNFENLIARFVCPSTFTLILEPFARTQIADIWFANIAPTVLQELLKDPLGELGDRPFDRSSKLSSDRIGHNPPQSDNFCTYGKMSIAI